MAGTAANGINISTYGVVFFETTSFTSITPGSSGTVLTSTGVGSLPTWQVPTAAQLPWTDEATSFTAVANNGYFISATATATLPTSPTQGDIVAFAVDAAATVLTITAAAGQVIRVGSAVSATAGTCESTAEGDSVFFTYRSTGLTWVAIGAPQGVFIVT